MAFSKKLEEIKSGFTADFWIANTLELFERFAFYGSKAVLTVFLANKVGLVNEAGTLAGLFSGVIFLLPIVAGVLVDRYGFKKTLMACFAIFTVGYFLIGLAGMSYGQEIMDSIGRKTYIITVLMLTAVGGSLIKPCIVGTVAQTSKPNVRGLGFSIYYTLGNIGGAIGPILALQIREDWGIEYVLIMSSVTTFFLLIGAWIFFNEPPQQTQASQRTFGKVFKDMLLVFGNIRFITFLIIFSGFWIMFWQIYYLVPFYSTEVLHYDNFEVLETVDAISIIFLTIPMAALVKTWRPITAMTLGFVFATLSWIIIATIPTVTATIIGIAIFALGESTQSPRFYEYVSTLAPRNQLGTFMGFSFLPVALGSFAAGPVADWLRNSYLTTNPSLMWFIVAMIGVVSTILMILYNVFVAPKTADSN
ncbi:MFS transporter [Chryseolinea sp. H1M3-3]|uniref:MFS transporter n=1 Tax=Chryseolinea sp. H1M3-3 TaxID=3034144 RepID=UPI0023EDB339|nr:MFS transporter [Chryseolinea sp. H1M3-3]